MKRVLCIADSCCDLIFGGLDRLPGPGEEVYGSHFSMQAGGGANTAVLLAKTGVPTAFWTMLGCDLPGRIVRETLDRSGVFCVDHGQRADRTPVSAVLSTREDRAFASFGEGSRLVESTEVLEKAIRNADIVHTYLGYCIAYPIAALCEKHGVLLSMDSSFCDATPEAFHTVLPHCDYYKGNEPEAYRLTGATSAEEALQALCGQVRKGAVITLGARGSIGTERGKKTVEQAAIMSGPFIDACGAGDAYAAGFLSGLANGCAFSECMRRGAVLAGQVVAAYGGCPDTIRFLPE